MTGEEAFEDEFSPADPKKKKHVVLWVVGCICLIPIGIVTVGLLATAVVPKLIDRLHDAFQGKAKADIMAITVAMDQYRINNQGDWPTSLDDLVAPDENGASYLPVDGSLIDPWGNKYILEPAEGTHPAVIWTLGEDGKRGGEGPSLDISSFMISNGDAER